MQYKAITRWHGLFSIWQQECRRALRAHGHNAVGPVSTACAYHNAVGPVSTACAYHNVVGVAGTAITCHKKVSIASRKI